MQLNEFPELDLLSDNDLLVVQEATTGILKSLKALKLKQYIGVGGIITPDEGTPPSGSSKWYRADGVTLNGAQVIAVLDKATGNNLSPLTGIVTLNPNSINNKPSLKFNNAALKSDSENYLAKHIFVIYRNNFSTFDEYACYFAYRTSPNSYKVTPSNETSLLAGVGGNTTITGISSLNEPVYIDNALKNSSDFNNYLIGISPGAVSEYHILDMINNASLHGTKTLCIGADSFSYTRYLQNADIAEIIIYPFILTPTQRTQLYAYFKSYYAFSFL